MSANTTNTIKNSKQGTSIPPKAGHKSQAAYLRQSRGNSITKKLIIIELINRRLK